MPDVLPAFLAFGGSPDSRAPVDLRSTSQGSPANGIDRLGSCDGVPQTQTGNAHDCHGQMSAPLPIGQNVWTKNCNIKSAFFFKLGTWPIHFSAALTAHGCKLKLQSFAEHEYVSGCVMQGAFVNKASWHQSTYPTMPSARLQTHSFLIECPISKCRHESNHTAHPLTCHSPRPHHTTSETS